MPAPPTLTQALQRVNQALPQDLAVAYRPVAKGGARSPTPYRIRLQGREIDRSASLTGAIFKAMRHAGDKRLAQPQLSFREDLFR